MKINKATLNRYMDKYPASSEEREKYLKLLEKAATQEEKQTILNRIVRKINCGAKAPFTK